MAKDEQIKKILEAQEYIEGDNGYFAAKEGKKCVNTLFEKIDDWYHIMTTTGYLDSE